MNRIATIRKPAWLWIALFLPLQSGAQAAFVGDPMAAYEKGDHATCSALFRERLAVMKWAPAKYRYNAARCLALAGHKEEASDQLRRAIDAPDFRVSGMASDPDLASLHELADWPELLRAAEQNAKQGPVTGAGVDIAYKRRHPPALPRGMRLKSSMEVVLLVGVAADDRPDHIIVERSSGDPVLDQIAVATAGKWKYQAAVADGMKFPAYVRVPFAFAP